MIPSLVAALLAIVAGFVLYFACGRLSGSTAGRLALLLGIAFLPGVAVVAGATHAYQESSSTTFCLSCHEMEDYGRSLFIDDRTVVPAVHYQKRLVDRDHACFQCHTNYAMFGDIQAKFDGLKHVWVHYLGGPPETIELYEPFPNANCLHCHDDARAFIEAPAHAADLEAIHAGDKSCLECHARGHGLDQLEEGPFWVGE
jgi:nitrate/TMAO reductase-like tetraheme cytochrome c subunit